MSQKSHFAVKRYDARLGVLVVGMEDVPKCRRKFPPKFCRRRQISPDFLFLEFNRILVKDNEWLYHHLEHVMIELHMAHDNASLSQLEHVMIELLTQQVPHLCVVCDSLLLHV